MSQPKVYEFAKELGMETLTLMDKIREWKLPVKSHMAALDEETVSEIKTRLEAEKEAAAPKKKVKKKVAKKKTVKKAVAKKAVAKKKITKSIGKVTKKTIGKVDKKVAKKATARKVIRRRASDAAEEKAKAAELAAKALQEATLQVDTATSDETSVEASPQVIVEGEVDKTVAKRKNIVGKMDLTRVTKAQSSKASTDAKAEDPRPSRTAPRNLRAGFVGQAPTLDPAVSMAEEARKREEKSPAKKKTGTSAKELPAVNFLAAEFRKREVIFQPKKKRPMIGRGEAKKTQITIPKASKRIVKVNGTISVQELAIQMGIKAQALIRSLMTNGVVANINMELDFDTVSLIAPEFKFEAENIHRSVDELIETTAFGNLDAKLVTKPPVVTVMGHVDHGKTTLLDAIRETKVVDGEAGGITQHIGAYSVTLADGHAITFIDTPGHEAFTAMRARGANATDVAIIVVAADDGMMPQTEEAINHAKAAGVPIIVAVNKMDRPGANPDKIKQQLADMELMAEDWGGTTIFCQVSALKREGIKELLEQIHLVAEMQELKANPERSATGVVIESKVQKGRGAVATLLIKDGSLSIGQAIVAGQVSGRVRTMFDENNKTVKTAGPGVAIEVMGLAETPMAGDKFDVCTDEESARKIAEQRQDAAADRTTPNSSMSLEELFAKVNAGDVKELSIILKADVAGSIEAIKGMMEKISTEEVKVSFIHSAVGPINESDVLLATTSGGICVGFNVRPDGGAQRLAKEKGIEIKTYKVIYEMADDIRAAMTGLLDPDIIEKSMGRAEVRDTFTVPKFGMIAGCYVEDGKIARSHILRLVRDGKIVYEGKVSSLKRFKDDVKEVAGGYECGIGIENFNDIKVGDVIESFIQEEKQREL